MRRTPDQALLDLRAHVASLAGRARRSPIAVFVYPPDWEALMLARFPSFASDCANSGWPVAIVDVGQGFRSELERRKGLILQLTELETTSPERLRHDLGVLAQRYLAHVLREPPATPAVVRLLVNTGSLATFASYSAIANDLATDAGAADVPPAVLAFPGEGDERSLNLLGLRIDTNYRVPRI